MLETKYCPICKGEIILRYHTPDKNFKISKGKIIRDDAWKGAGFDDPELLFECLNDREHIIDHSKNDEWENTIREEFYRGTYYDD